MSFRNVSTLKHGDIALIEFHYPPVNALGASVRTGIFSKLQELIADTSIKAIVLKGKGRFFSGGADINEFGIESAKPTLRELINAVEASEKPIIAAIDGAALGGGMELALGCHYRVGSVKAKLGLPEVKLGLLPGAGGTQRLPRLIGPIAALELIVEGDSIDAESALKLGLLDQIIGDEVNNGDIAFARNFLNKPIRRLSQDNSMIDAKDRRAFENDAARLLKRNRGLEAPKACVQAIRDTFELSFIEASQRERHAFMRLLNGSESKAQRHLFFAERKALKVPGLGKEVKPRDVKRIAVIGAGTMGSGIAMCLTINGFRVTLIDINPDNLKLGLERIRNNFKKTQSRGDLTTAEVDAALGALKGATSLTATADVDMVIEAVFEKLDLKKKIFAELDKVANPCAVLASNTSTLDINEIANVTTRPQNVMGMHFFSPANVMRLLENIRCARTAPDVLLTANAVGKRAGKIPVTVGVCNGFVGNRMLYTRARQVEALLQSGVSPKRLDKAAQDFGFAMGPCAVSDLAGLDIGYAARREAGRRSPVADAITELGRYGQKTGAGYFLYDKGSRTPIPDPAIDILIAEVAQKEGVKRREISDEEITERLVLSLINEGARILDEGVATRASDIDLIYIYGYGFPVAKGGPMFYADMVGLDTLSQKLKYYARITGDDTLLPAPLLLKLAEKGTTFSSWFGEESN